MAGDKGSGKKGFAGLESMVSEVEVPKASAPEPIREEEEAVPQESARVQPQPAFTGNPSSGTLSGKWWLIPIGVIVFFLWVGASEKRTSAPAPEAPAPAPEASAPTPEAPAPAPEAPAPAPEAPAPAPEAPAPAYVPEPAPTNTSNDEEMPPVGNGLVFNTSQIRYCLSQKIRISAWQSKVNDYSGTSVNAFNEAVNDYNIRCLHFQYRTGTLESVRSEVEANRYALTQQGDASAAANP